MPDAVKVKGNNDWKSKDPLCPIFSKISRQDLQEQYY